MPEQIFAEQIFDKHATAHGLPPRSTDETLDAYVTRVGGDLLELPRRLTLAVQAARVADHAECALWCAQAKQELPVKR
jgi:hypothetical protein